MTPSGIEQLLKFKSINLLPQETGTSTR